MRTYFVDQAGSHLNRTVPASDPHQGATAAQAHVNEQTQSGEQPSATVAPSQLVGLYLYPIKSCAPQQEQRWPVGPNGLLYDREWALLDDAGKVGPAGLRPGRRGVQ